MKNDERPLSVEIKYNEETVLNGAYKNLKKNALNNIENIIKIQYLICLLSIFSGIMLSIFLKNGFVSSICFLPLITSIFFDTKISDILTDLKINVSYYSMNPEQAIKYSINNNERARRLGLKFDENTNFNMLYAIESQDSTRAFHETIYLHIKIDNEISKKVNFHRIIQSSIVIIAYSIFDKIIYYLTQ